MNNVKFRKEVSRLPDILEPDTIYYVRVGVGFDLYVSDHTGRIAHKLNGSSGNGSSSDYDFYALRQDIFNEFPQQVQYLEELSAINKKPVKIQVEKLYKILCSSDIIDHLFSEPGEFNLLNRLLSNQYLLFLLLQHPKLANKLSDELIRKYFNEDNLNEYSQQLIASLNLFETSSETGLSIYRQLVGDSVFCKFILDNYDRISDKQNVLLNLAAAIPLANGNDRRELFRLLVKNNPLFVKGIDFYRHDNSVLNINSFTDKETEIVLENNLYFYQHTGGLYNYFKSLNAFDNCFANQYYSGNRKSVSEWLYDHSFSVQKFKSIVDTQYNTSYLFYYLWSATGTGPEESPGKFMHTWDKSNDILTLNDYINAINRRIESNSNNSQIVSNLSKVKSNIVKLSQIFLSQTSEKNIDKIKYLVNQNQFHESYYQACYNQSYEVILLFLLLANSTEYLPITNEIAKNKNIFNRLKQWHDSQNKQRILTGDLKHYQYQYIPWILCTDKSMLTAEDLLYLNQFPILQKVKNRIFDNGFEESWVKYLIKESLFYNLDDLSVQKLRNSPKFEESISELNYKEKITSSLNLRSRLPQDIVNLINSKHGSNILDANTEYSAESLRAFNFSFNLLNDDEYQKLGFLYQIKALNLQIFGHSIEEFIKSRELQYRYATRIREVQNKQLINSIFKYVKNNQNFKKVAIWVEDGISENINRSYLSKPGSNYIVFATLGSYSSGPNRAYSGIRAILENESRNSWPSSYNDYQNNLERYNTCYVTRFDDNNSRYRGSNNEQEFEQDVNCFWSGNSCKFKEFGDGYNQYMLFEYIGP